MDYFLQKVGGRPAWQAVTLRRCTPVEAPAVFALQNEVRAAMPHPEQFVPDTLENITGYLRTGICIGAWQQGRLGAYLILRLCGQSDENYAAFLGVPQSQWQHWANADSAVVHPDWRGNGLAARHAGSGSAAAAATDHPSGGYRQPGQQLQPAQRTGRRLRHPLPSGDVRRLRPLSAGKAAVTLCSFGVQLFRNVLYYTV